MKTKSFLVVLSVIVGLICLQVLWTHYQMQTTFGVCWVAAAALAFFAKVISWEGEQNPGNGYWAAAVVVLLFAGFFIWAPLNYYNIF